MFVGFGKLILPPAFPVLWATCLWTGSLLGLSSTSFVAAGYTMFVRVSVRMVGRTFSLMGSSPLWAGGSSRHRTNFITTFISLWVTSLSPGRSTRSFRIGSSRFRTRRVFYPTTSVPKCVKFRGTLPIGFRFANLGTAFGHL